MLRLIFATALVVSCSTFTSATFLDTLHQVHASDAFNNLTHSDQVLVLELLSEAQAGELKIYVDDVGFENVLALLDRIPDVESHYLIQLFIAELNKEEQGAIVIGKRSLVDVLQTAMNSAAYQNLPPADQQFVQDVLTAAENGTLTQYVSVHGYAEVLRLVDVLPQPEKHLLEEYMYEHLEAESLAAGAAVGK